MTTENPEPNTVDFSGATGSEPVRADNLHSAGNDGSGLARLLLESETPDDLQRMLEGETNADHVLGNLSDEELWERRFNIMNNEEFLYAMHPPKESVLQGDLREEFGLKGPKYAASPETVHDISDSRDAAYARSSRARDGWFIEQITNMIQEIRRRDDGDNEGSGGLVSSFLGGGK